MNWMLKKSHLLFCISWACDCVYRQCEENAPLYQALQVEQIFDIEALLSNISNLTDVR